jgi:hypothetical protein
MSLETGKPPFALDSKLLEVSVSIDIGAEGDQTRGGSLFGPTLRHFNFKDQGSRNLYNTGKYDGVKGSSSPIRLNPVSNYNLSTF